MQLLQNLNEPQQKAVLHTNGSLLLLAGPGSGKTRVITHRIANMIANGIPANNILALTFTNKAAKEMKHRVSRLVGTCGVSISTFHSFCAQILYKYAAQLEYRANFSIYDDSDTRRLIQQIIFSYTRENPDEKESLKSCHAIEFINYCKNKGIFPEDVEKYFEPIIEKKRANPNQISFGNLDFTNPVYCKYQDEPSFYITMYRSYQSNLRLYNAMDFDDLIMYTSRLFMNYNDVLVEYQERFRYIMIDEFQDTNIPQYQVAAKLAQKYRNICVVGDPDQSIYAWRGANLGNIFEFEKDFPERLIIKLEQNYRSTQSILHAASKVIENNRVRKHKELWTSNGVGYPLRLVETFNQIEEAEKIVGDIQRQNKLGTSYEDMAILYRINAQSHDLENALIKYHIPYIIVGGLKFFDRMEIKDVMAYLRLVVNKNDNIALQRIISSPRRGIGHESIEKFKEYATNNRISLFQAMLDVEYMRFGPKIRNAVQKFTTSMCSVEEYDGKNLRELVKCLLERTGYMAYIQDYDINLETNKTENINQFYSLVHKYERENDHSLVGFLQSIALFFTEEEDDDISPKVKLMTLHASKGLEFPIVYIVGLCDGVLPHKLNDNIEEERRLFFVGITRAQKLCTISYFKEIYKNGNFIEMPHSNFLAELPPESYQWLYHCDKKTPKFNRGNTSKP